MTPVETVQAIYAAFTRGDVAFILGQVAPDATWRQPDSVPWGGTHRGPEGAGTFFSRLNDANETVEFRVDEVIGAGNDVFAVGVYAGKARKTGKTARTEWIHRWRIENGKVVLYDGFIDTAKALAALS